MRRVAFKTGPGFLAAVVGLGLALAVLPAEVALAHANLDSSSIVPRSTITTSPPTLTLTFTEETSPTETQVVVTDSNGKRVDKNDLKVSGDTATVGLLPLTNGVYTVQWHTFTEDDSGIKDGNFTFTVALAETPTPPPAPSPTSAPPATPSPRPAAPSPTAAAPVAPTTAPPTATRPAATATPAAVVVPQAPPRSGDGGGLLMADGTLVAGSVTIFVVLAGTARRLVKRQRRG